MKEKRIKVGVNRFFRLLNLKRYQFVRKVRRSISNRNYIILGSILIGIVAGLAGMVLKYFVFIVREWMYGNDPTQSRIGFVLFPIMGIILTILYIKYVHNGKLDIGFSNLIRLVSKKRVNLPRHETYAHIVSSSLTVGLGGSVGLEAPIVRTGAAIGSNIGRILQVGRNQQTLLLACGSAAGMASIFNSPVAGIIFAFEVLITDISLGSFIPLIIASATGAVVARYFYYEQLFYIPTEGWDLFSIPFYILLGVICGLYSAYFIRSILFAQSRLTNQPNVYLKLTAGGLLLGLMVFLFPPLFGEGYETINHLLLGEYDDIASHSIFYTIADKPVLLLIMALVIILLKTTASAITISLGGNGGVFAPAMFSGALLGFIFCYGINLFDLTALQTSDFIVVAMAGILSGVMKSPLTGIFLIAEITGGYALFVPLMIVSAISYFVTHWFEPYSIFTKELFFKGQWIPMYEKDLKVLDQINLADLIEKNFSVINPEQNLGEFVKIVAKSHRNLFPVLNEQNTLLGIVLLDDIREIMFQQEKYSEVLVKELMHNPPANIYLGESMEKIMKKFDDHHAWNLPVLDGTKYLGFISRSSVFQEYRKVLKSSSNDI